MINVLNVIKELRGVIRFPIADIVINLHARAVPAKPRSRRCSEELSDVKLNRYTKSLSLGYGKSWLRVDKASIVRNIKPAAQPAAVHLKAKRTSASE